MPQIVRKPISKEEHADLQAEQWAASIGLPTARTEPYIAAQYPLELYTARPTAQLDVYRRHILLADVEGLGDDDRYALARLALTELNHGIPDDDGSKFFKRSADDAQNFIDLREMFLSAEVPGEGKRFRNSSREDKIAEVMQWDEWKAFQNTASVAPENVNMAMAVAMAGGTVNPAAKKPGLDAMLPAEQDAWIKRYEQEHIAPADYTANKVAYERLLSDRGRAYGLHAALWGEHNEGVFYGLEPLDQELMAGYVSLVRSSQPQQDVSGLAVFTNSYRRFAENGVEMLRQLLTYEPEGGTISQVQQMRDGSSLADDTRLATRQYLETANPDYSRKSLPARIGYGAIESIPFTGTILAGPGGLAFAAASVGGGLQDDLVRHHGADPRKALPLSLSVGILSVGLERLQVALGLEGGAAVREIIKKSIGSKILSGLRTAGSTVGKELVVEEVQNVLEGSVPLIGEAVADANDDLDADDVARQLWEELPQTAGVVAVFSGIFGGAGFISNKLAARHSTLEKVRALNQVSEHISTLPDGSDLGALRARVDAEASEDGKRNVIEGAGLTRESYARKIQEFDAIEEEVSGLMDAAAAEVVAAVERLAGDGAKSDADATAEVTASGVDTVALQDFTARFAQAFPRALPVRVVQSVAELPAPVQELAAGTLGPKAAKHGGEVFVVLDNVSSFGDAIAQIAHEQLVHVGLDLRTSEGRQEFLSNLRTRLDASGVTMDSIRAAVSAYSGIAEQVRTRAIEAGIGEADAQTIADNYLVEEFLARAVEKSFNGESLSVEEKGIVDVFLGWLRELFGVQAGPDADRILLEAAHELMIDLGGQPSLESQLAVAQRQLPSRQAASAATEAGMAKAETPAESETEQILAEPDQVPEVPAEPEATNVGPTNPQGGLDVGAFPPTRLRVSEIHVDPARFQFKSADGEGVQKPLSGEWNTLAAGLILVWQAQDGTYFVANGHHRLSHARRLGVEAVNVQIMREVDGHTDVDARRLGAEANIVDGKGTIHDHARYFRNEGTDYDDATARARGLKGHGYTIARLASDSLFGQFASGGIDEGRTLAIIQGGGSNGVAQGLGIRKVLDNPRINPDELFAYVGIVRRDLESGAAPSAARDVHETEDMFASAEDDAIQDWVRDAEAKAKRIASQVRSVREDLNAIKGTVKSDSRIAAAAKMGVTVDDAEKARAERDRLAKKLEALIRGVEADTKLSLAEERAIVQPSRAEETDLFGNVLSPGRPAIRERDVVRLPDGREVTATIGMRFPAGSQVVGEQADIFGGSAGPQGRPRGKKSSGPATEQTDFFADVQATLFSLRDDAPLLIISEEILQGKNPTIARVLELFPGTSESEAKAILAKGKAVARAVLRVQEEASRGIERSPRSVRRIVDEIFSEGQVRGEFLERARQSVEDARKREREQDLRSRRGLSAEEIADLPDDFRRVAYPIPVQELRKPPAEDEVETTGEKKEEAEEEEKDKPAPPPLSPDDVSKMLDQIADAIRRKLIKEGVFTERRKDWMQTAEFRAEYRATLGSIFGQMAVDLTYGQPRARAVEMIRRLRNRTTLPAIERDAHTILELINVSRIKETRAELLSKLRRRVSKFAGRVSRTTEIEKRRIGPLQQEQINWIKEALATPEKAQEGRDDLATIIDRLEFEAEIVVPGEDDLSIRQKQIRVEIYKLFGGLGHYTSSRGAADVAQALEYLEQVVTTGKNLVDSAREKRNAELSADRGALIAAMEQTVSGASTLEPENIALDYAQGSMRLKDLLYVAIRGSKDAARDGADSIIDKIDRGANKAHNERDRIVEEKLDSFAKGVSEVYGIAEQHVQRHIASLEKPRAEYQKYSDNGKVQLSKSNLMQVVAALQQEDVRERALKNESWARWLSILPKIEAELDAADWAMIEWLRGAYDRQRELVGPIVMEITGYPVVPPSSKYLPIRAEVLGGFGEKHIAVPVIPKSFEARVSHSRDFDQTASIFQIYVSRVHEDAHLAGYAKWNRHVRGIFAHQDVQRLLKRVGGERFLRQLLEQLADEATAGRMTRLEGEKALNRYLTVTTAIGLGGNLPSALKGFVTEYPQFAHELGIRKTLDYTIRGANIADPVTWETWRKIAGDPLFKKRFGGTLAESVSHIDFRTFDRRAQAAVNGLLLFHRLGDAGPLLHVGGMIYRQEMASPANAHMSDAERHRHAMDEVLYVTRVTQMSDRQADRSAWVRRGGSWVRALTQFMGPTLMFLSRDIAAIRELYSSPDARVRKRAVRTLAVNHLLIPSLFWGAAQLANGILFNRWPSDDDKLSDEAAELIVAMLAGPFSGLVVFGSLGIGTARMALGGDSYGVGQLPGSGGLVSAVVHVSKAAREAGSELWDAAQGDAASMDWDETLEELDKALKAALAPYRHVRQAVEGYGDN